MTVRDSAEERSDRPAGKDEAYADEHHTDSGLKPARCTNGQARPEGIEHSRNIACEPLTLRVRVLLEANDLGIWAPRSKHWTQAKKQHDEAGKPQGERVAPDDAKTDRVPDRGTPNGANRSRPRPRVPRDQGRPFPEIDLAVRSTAHGIEKISGLVFGRDASCQRSRPRRAEGSPRRQPGCRRSRVNGSRATPGASPA